MAQDRPGKMKAAVRYRYGPPILLSVQEREKPVPGNDEVLIRVHAATVNRTDCGILWAKPFIIRFITGKAAWNINNVLAFGVVGAAIVTSPDISPSASSSNNHLGTTFWAYYVFWALHLWIPD